MCYYIYVCVHWGQRTTSDIIYTVLSQDLSLIWSSQINLDLLSRDLQGSTCVCLYSTGIIGAQHHGWHFFIGLKGWTYILVLAMQVLYLLKCHSKPGSWFFKSIQSSLLSERVDTRIKLPELKAEADILSDKLLSLYSF